jgi:hypothetical protein
MKRVAINFTFTADLDRVPGWGHQPSDWSNLVQSELSRNSHYKPEVVVNEIIEKPYGWDDTKYWIRPTFVTAADRDMVLRANLDRIISALTAMQDSDADLGHADEARLSVELIEQLKTFKELT